MHQNLDNRTFNNSFHEKFSESFFEVRLQEN